MKDRLKTGTLVTRLSMCVRLGSGITGSFVKMIRLWPDLQLLVIQINALLNCKLGQHCIGGKNTRSS